MMKFLNKIKIIRRYVAAYRIKKQNQIRKELIVSKVESEAMEYLRNWETNKNNDAYLYLKHNWEGGLK